jgi:hypothetical protein
MDTARAISMPEVGFGRSGNSRDYRTQSPDPAAIVPAWIEQPPLTSAGSSFRCGWPWFSDWLAPVCSWRHVVAAAVPRRQLLVVHLPEKARHRHSSPVLPSTGSRCRRGPMVADLPRVDSAGRPRPAGLPPLEPAGILRLELAALVVTPSSKRPSRLVPVTSPRAPVVEPVRTARRWPRIGIA